MKTIAQWEKLLASNSIPHDNGKPLDSKLAGLYRSTKEITNQKQLAKIMTRITALRERQNARKALQKRIDAIDAQTANDTR